MSEYNKENNIIFPAQSKIFIVFLLHVWGNLKEDCTECQKGAFNCVLANEQIHATALYLHAHLSHGWHPELSFCTGS